MAKPPKTGKQQKQPQPAPKKPARPPLALGKKNYIIMGVGLLTISAGFIFLAAGSITIAPLLLVVGYCILIPVALLIR